MRRNVISTPAKRQPMAKRARVTKSATRAMPLYRAPRANRNGGPWPLQKSCQLTYSAVLSVTVTTGAGSYVMSCNGMFDPDITGTGTQPLYFDQLMELYNHYVVTSSSVEFQALGSETRQVMTVFLDDDASTGGGALEAAQRPGAVSTCINIPGAQAPTLRKTWNGSSYFGPGILNNSLFRGDSSSNPAEQMYYVVKVYDPSLASTTYLIRCKVTYNATFTELKTVTPS